jgi:hypothetical protein
MIRLGAGPSRKPTGKGEGLGEAMVAGGECK